MKTETPVEAIRSAGEAALTLPATELPPVLGELERLKGLLWIRLNTPEQGPPEAPEGDRLLGVPEAAAKARNGAQHALQDSRRLPVHGAAGAQVEVLA